MLELIIKTICEECGKEFIGDGGEVKKKCVEHELIEHYSADKLFNERLNNVLLDLDTHYKTKTSFSFKGVSVYEDYYGGIENISYYFNISNDNLNKDLQIDVYDYTQIPTIRDIKNAIEKHFKANIKKYYEGIVKFEDFSGGNGADDYVLDGQYMRSICQELVDKKIRITILE